MEIQQNEYVAWNIGKYAEWMICLQPFGIDRVISSFLNVAYQPSGINQTLE